MYTDRPKKSIIKVRFIIVLMATLCPVVCYMSRQNLSLAIVAMVKDHKADNQTQPDATDDSCSAPLTLDEEPKPGSYGPKYDWGIEEVAIILEAFFWTYVFFQIPAARLAERFGAKWIFFAAAVGSSLISFISPWAASLHPYALALARTILGACQTALYPAGYTLYSQWLPPSERSQALPVLGAGAYIGSIIAASSTGYFAEQQRLGWEYAFYAPSVLCAVWAVIWIFVGASEPRQHGFISLEEIEYIESRMEVRKSSSVGKKSLSWIKLLTSQHVWAMIAAFFASNWSFHVTMLMLPSYLNYILQVPLSQNGVINSGIYIIFCLCSPIIGSVSTLMVETRSFGLTHIRIRKMFESIGLFSQAICLVSMPILGCNKAMVFVLLGIQTVLFSFINGGEVQLPSDLSTDYAGTIYALGNCIGSSTGFIVPRVYSLAVKNRRSMADWNLFFCIAAAVATIGATIFLIFGKNDLQDFSTDIGESKVDIYKLSTEDGFILQAHRAKEKTKKEKQLSI